MPGAMNFWGGLMQGLAGSLAQQQKLQQDQEELKLKQDLAKKAIELEHRKQKQAEQEQSARDKMKEIIGQSVAPGTMPTTGLDPNILQREPADMPLEDQTPTGIRESLVNQRAMDVGQVGLKQSMIDVARPQDLPGILGMAGKVQQGHVVGAGGALVDPTGKILFQNPATQRMPMGADSRTFAFLLEKHNGDIEAARAEYNAMVAETAKNRGYGGTMGGIEAKGTPAAQAAATNQAIGRTLGAPIPESADAAMTSMRTILQQLDRVNPKTKSLYKDEFVGPIHSITAGLQEKWGETPIIGNAVGGPISEDEAQFRQAVNSIYNEIANLRGGKVLPEQELKRIEKEAVLLTASPTSFRSRYEGFKIMVSNMLANRIANVKTPRGQLGATPQATPLDQGIEESKTINGQHFIKKNGQWFLVGQ